MPNLIRNAKRSRGKIKPSLACTMLTGKHGTGFAARIEDSNDSEPFGLRIYINW